MSDIAVVISIRWKAIDDRVEFSFHRVDHSYLVSTHEHRANRGFIEIVVIEQEVDDLICADDQPLAPLGSPKRSGVGRSEFLEI